MTIVKFMMQSRVSRHGMALIACVTLIYSALLVIVPGCASAYADRSHHQQHHHDEQGSSGLNALCAWACQATADAVLAMGPSPAVTEHLASSADLIPYPFIHSADVSHVPTRAPPSTSFVRLG
ncbi:MAG: hypothetical protein FJ247_03710 [Nitrospira sp.]|nr:hypothetical protein [Nitrospira sp.]